MTTFMTYHCGLTGSVHRAWIRGRETDRTFAGMNPANGRRSAALDTQLVQGAITPKAGGGMT